MSGEVSVLSGAPVIDVDPITGMIQLILGGPPGPSGATGGAKTWLNGTVAPSGGDGTVGDFYLNTTTHQYYGPKSGGGWGSPHNLVGPAGADGTDGIVGADGVDGRTWYSGTGAPSGGTGANGDYYMDTAASAYYGPKTAGAWGSAHSIVGATGTNGANGTNGRTWLNGAGAPSGGTGADGDFYVDTTNKNFYGPKTAGAWGTGIPFAGNTWLNGAGVPSNALGNNGDLYLDTTNSAYYGPKSGGVWGSGTPLFGKTWRSGSGAPSNALGVDGDFYLDTTNSAYYGPKAGGVYPAAVSLMGTTWLSGTATPPSNALGKNGDFYLNTTTKGFYGPKAAGVWPAIVSLVGATGANGNSWLSGSGAPAGGTGANGDFYLDVTAKAFYGPKASGAWGSAISLVGAAGVNGRTWFNGSGAPSAGLGADGDYYMDTTAKAYYGPKTAGAWGSAISMIGATNVTAAYDATLDTSEGLGHASDPRIDPYVVWASGASLQSIVQTLADGLSIEGWIRDIHGDSQQQHGMPAPGPQLLFKSPAGIITFLEATTPPAGNPPSGSIYGWVEDEAIKFRNKDGDETQVVPGWRNIFVKSLADVVKTSNVSLIDVLVAPENAVALAEYIVEAELYYLAAAAAATGGIRVGWTLPSGASLDWSAEGPGFDPNVNGAGWTAGWAMPMTSQHGTAASVLSGYGGQGTSKRLPLKIKGLLTMGATAGAPSLQFAQSSSSSTSTTVKARSWMKMERVA